MPASKNLHKVRHLVPVSHRDETRVSTRTGRCQGTDAKVVGAQSERLGVRRLAPPSRAFAAIEIERAVLLGFSEGSPMSAFFAAANPERVSKLILCGGFAKAFSTEEAVSQRVKIWGTGALMGRAAASLSTNPDAVKLLAKFERLSASPGTARAYMSLNRQIDVTSILPNVRVPTLVLHRRTDALVPIERGRELAALIPGAKFIEYPEGDHVPFTGDAETILGDIQEFVTGERESSTSDLERILATVMFTDIVDSTRSAAEMGDQQWRRLLDSHDRIAKQAVEKHRGNLIKTRGRHSRDL